MSKKPKTVVIGGGPGGASAAIYLARFFHDVTLIDAGEAAPGRTGMATHLENFLGHDTPINGETFLGRINKQLDRLGIKQIKETVTKLEIGDREAFTITSDASHTFTASFVVLAVGLSDNMPEIDGLDPYYEHAIFHCLTCDWYWNRDKKATVVTNDDRGIQTALMIQGLHAPPLLSVIPAANPKFSSDLIEIAEQQGVHVYTNPLKELIGENGYLEAVKLADGTKVETEVLFTRLGHTRYDHFLDEGGLEVEREGEEGFIKVNWRTFETSIKNLFAIGPCNAGPDQASIASGEGALAALEIHARIIEAWRDQ